MASPSFAQPDFVNKVAAVLFEAKLEPGAIELELTESVLMQDVEGARETLRALKSHGVGLSVDDFGTGYSSLAYLRRLPIDTLKIDRSFVRDMLAHAQSRTIVESTIALARGLGLQVTAEGVEQQAEVELLRELGCHCGQGYLFSRPQPQTQLIAKLQAGYLATADQ